MSWQITLHPKVEKSIPKLPNRVQDALSFLLREIEQEGPLRETGQIIASWKKINTTAT